MEQKPKLHPAVAALIVIVLVGLVATAVIIVNNAKGDTASTTTQTATTDSHDHVHETDEATVDATDTAEYEDGTYNATGSYLSPGGTESIELTVVIKDDVITDTTLVELAKDRDAKEHQELFAQHYKDLVVGKKINGLSLSRVAGSSLTSNGFNDALDEIRNEARA
jgi:uncharacterized protein with FMN-binding domain